MVIRRHPVTNNSKVKCQATDFSCLALIYVRLTGLEPALREQPDPKSGASTNSATGA